MRIAGEKRRQLRELDAFIGQRLGLVARGLAANRALRRFLVMDAARLFRKALAHVFGIAHDLAQPGDQVRGEASDCFPCAFASAGTSAGASAVAAARRTWTRADG